MYPSGLLLIARAVWQWHTEYGRVSQRAIQVIGVSTHRCNVGETSDSPMTIDKGRRQEKVNKSSKYMETEFGGNTRIFDIEFRLRHGKGDSGKLSDVAATVYRNIIG
jgi:hypothetical protein